MLTAARVAKADITCFNFAVQPEAQAVLNALPNDPFALDNGPQPAEDGSLDDYDTAAHNGLACDRLPVGSEAAPDRPQSDEPATTPPETGQDALPNGVVAVTVVEAVRANDIQVQLVNGDQQGTVVMIGIATPEFEGGQVPRQCFAAETTARLQQLLPPGRTVYLEIDPHAYTSFHEWHRHVWVKSEQDGKYYLASEILVAEGYAVVATDRLGWGKPDARTNPPYDSAYRDRLRRAQAYAVRNKAGLWGACGG